MWTLFSLHLILHYKKIKSVEMSVTKYYTVEPPQHYGHLITMVASIILSHKIS